MTVHVIDCKQLCLDVYDPARAVRVRLLDRIDVHIERGEWVSIVGRNGSGKSTLAQVIAGIVPASEGTVNRNFAAGPVPYVMQHDYQLFGATPWEDVVFALESRGEDPHRIPIIADRTLNSVGLSGYLHTPVEQLSGGQRQLAAAAGCLAANAPVLMFDEATSMLDLASREQVIGMAREMHCHGHTIIWLTHLLDEVVFGNRVIALERGGVAFDGSTTRFFYGSDPTGGSLRHAPCEQLGYEPPLAIQVAKSMLDKGWSFGQLPLTAERLAEEVTSSRVS